MIEQQKTQDIDAVIQQIAALREQITVANTEVAQDIEKRDKLNEQARLLRQEIIALKKERDSLNLSVKALKQQRDEVRTQIQPYIDEIEQHVEKIHALREKRSGVPRHELQKEFDAIEWRIQTTSLDLQEEKRLIEQVKQLEIQLSVYKKIDVHSHRINELKTELRTFTDKADGFHQELTTNASKSQELHTLMQAKLEELKKVREEATSLHVQYLQTRGKVKVLYEELNKCVDLRRKLFEERHKLYEERHKSFEAARDEDAKLKKAKEEEIKEKLGSEVRGKLERGEKLDWREFQLLAGDDSETED